MRTKIAKLSLLSFLLLVLMSCRHPEQNNIEVEYLRPNSSILDTTDSGFSLSEIISNEEIANASIFFTAEKHGIAINKTLELLFLKYLVNNFDYKYILVEMPLSHAELLNQYLAEQDIELLNRSIEAVKGTYGSMTENYTYWQNLCEFNQTLPENKKLTLIGVDLEFQPHFTINWLQENYLKSDPPAAIKADIDLLLNVETDQSSYTDLFNICKTIKISLAESPEIYKQYLGEDYINFKQIVESAVGAKLVYEKWPDRDIIPWNSFRDSIITQNFLIQDERLSNPKYFGQWGNLHTFQSNTLGVNWFAVNLQNTAKFKDKIISFHYVYEDSESRSNTGEVYSINTCSKNDFYSFTDTDYPVIFNLSNNNSPYDKDLIKVCTELENESLGVTTDYFQYFILLKEATAGNIYP